jgi:hypothetical protein
VETTRILKEKYIRHTRIYTDGSKKEEEDGYAAAWGGTNDKKEDTPTKLNI